MPAHRTEYDQVPHELADDADGAVVDPHWQELQVSGQLPTSYLPAAMPGTQAGWRRVAASVLIALLLLATAGGICLTYGPSELFHLLDT